MKKREFSKAAITPIEQQWRDYIILSEKRLSIVHYSRLRQIEDRLTERIANLYSNSLRPRERNYQKAFQELNLNVAAYRLDRVLKLCGETWIGRFSRNWFGGFLLIELGCLLLGFPTKVRSEITALNRAERYEAIRGFLIGVLCLSWASSGILEDIEEGL